MLISNYAWESVEDIKILKMWKRLIDLGSCVELLYEKPEGKKGQNIKWVLETALQDFIIKSKSLQVGRDFHKYFHHDLWRLFSVSER